MSAAPWLKFYPRDWRGDQALRAISLGARGLWMEMLCVMHEASPYGHLVLGGLAVSNDVLARMAGAGVEEVSAMLVELESAGVLSRTRKGVIYSRRMVKDKGRAEKGRKAATKRWSQPTENSEENPVPIRSPIREPITQKPEARVEEVRARASASPSEFETRCRAVAAAISLTRPIGPGDRTQLQAWLADGLDFDLHIIPAAREIAARELGKGRGVSGFKYLDGGVRDYAAAWTAERENLQAIAGGRG